MEDNDFILERIKNDNGKRYTSQDAIERRNARKKLVKIAINPKHGSFAIPKYFSKEDNNGKDLRVALAEYIESLEDTHVDINQDIYDNFVNDHNWYIKCGKLFFFKEPNALVKIIHRLEVVEVDTRRKWKIDNYDGAESIVYFEEPKLVNADLNMYEW